ncbi:MAG: DUF488 domain-containing protein [Hyphomonadaceae bacterium]|nr:DUF488 domain-containing protein [Hyphomonadaceae bacterium]
MKTFWTIGYENVGATGFVAALKAANITTLVDVRDIANSRRAGFSKNALAASLAEAGIGYIHMKALGTPKAGRAAARKGDAKTMHRIFEAKLADPESEMALAELSDLVRKGRVCLMCLEHDWRQCHRAIVAARLEALGLMATHLSPAPTT